MTFLLKDIEASLKFEYIRKIGDGGSCEVFLSKDKQTGADIAIKKIPITNFSHIDEYFAESRKLYLTRHHNIAQINYGCKDDGFIYLSMPYYKNGSIGGILDNRFLTSREIIRYSLHFLSGLNNVHSKLLIHYDLKPENILISDNNVALISDFGVAQYMNKYGFSTSRGTTRLFAPPEFFAQTEHNNRFDIYQAGMTMYLMCNGNDMFNKIVMDAHVHNGVADPSIYLQNLNKGLFTKASSYLPHIPKQLLKVISKSLAPNPSIRYSSVVEILNDLCKIDKANDWVHSNANGTEYWNLENKIVSSTLENGTWNIKAINNGRNNKTYSKLGLDSKSKNDLLYECLNNPW